jgi:phosphinothricin acetyltransferase
MEYLIRKANNADLKFILEILNHEIKHGTAVYDYDEKSLAEIERWYQDKKDNNYPLLVTVANDQVIGYATYGPFRPREGYKYTIEHSVYLHKDHYGKGLGKALMQKLIPIAQENGFHRMIGVVDASNAGSCKFHLNLGFKEVGRLNQAGYKFEKWLDVVLLQFNLDETLA